MKNVRSRQWIMGSLAGAAVVISGAVLAAGVENPTGTDFNTCLGGAAGGVTNRCEGGNDNTFIGNAAGTSAGGSDNTAVGSGAGSNIVSGATENTLLGTNAGFNLGAGDENTFVGFQAGINTNNANATTNTFVGAEAGPANTSGEGNIFIGAEAGVANTTGIGNVMIGNETGNSTDNENFNTFIGLLSDGANGVSNAGAIGFQSQVTQSNSLVLGAIPGVNEDPELPANEYVSVGMGTPAPTAPLHIRRVDGDSDASLLIEDASSSTRNRTMLSLVNNGNARIALENTANGARFEMGTNAGNGNFIFISDGEPIFTLTPNGRVLFGIASNPTLDVFPNGNGTFRGTVTAVDYLMSSDVNEKQDIEEMEGNLVLAKLEQLPVTEWSYKKTPEARHVGPMAQDFKKVFNLGTDETKINPADMAGVSLAAVKALKAEKDAQIEDLRVENAKKTEEIMALKTQFAALKAQLEQMDRQ